MDFRELRKRSKKSGRKAALAEAPDQLAPTAEVEPVLAPPPPQALALETTTTAMALAPAAPAPVDITAAPDDADELLPLESSFESAPADTRVEILRFRLKSEYFALYLSEIEEIIKPRGFTMVPRAPTWVLGIVSLRGTMVPVVDLARRLSIQAESPATQRIIIISHGGELCGLLVDDVKNVELIDPQTVESIPAALHETAGRFLNGLVRVDSDLIAMVDLGAILTVEGNEK